MTRFHRQAGISFWSFMFLAVLIGMILLMAIKLVPPYLEYGKVKTTMENVARQPGAANLSRPEIQEMMQRRFDIEDVRSIDLNKALTVEKAMTGTTLRMTWEVRVPMVHNITAVVSFDEKLQLR
jgi:hypothetical protein